LTATGEGTSWKLFSYSANPLISQTKVTNPPLYHVLESSIKTMPEVVKQNLSRPWEQNTFSRKIYLLNAQYILQGQEFCYDAIAYLIVHVQQSDRKTANALPSEMHAPYIDAVL